MPSGKDDQSLRIAVLGAGMSGLAAVAKLKQAGYTQIDLFFAEIVEIQNRI